MGCFLCFAFPFLRLGFLDLFSASPPLFFYLLLFCRVSLLTNFHIFPFHLLAASSMACSKMTPNPPPSPRTANSRRASPFSFRDPPRDPNVPLSQVVRPAPSRPNQAQPNPPHTSAAVRPLPNYKQLYLWAFATLLDETSSINSDCDILRHKKGDQTHLSFSKEHDDKVFVHPCPPGEPICTDNQGHDGDPFCFIYATMFKKVKLRFPLSLIHI